MGTESDDKICELGVEVSMVGIRQDVTQDVKTKRVFSRQRSHRLYREFALTTLSTLLLHKKENTASESPTQLAALDAYTGSGIAAIQWKKHLKDSVHVTAADHEDVSLLEQNAERNGMRPSLWKLDATRTPGDPRNCQPESEIATCVAEAKSLMAMESYNFIYLTPHKNNGTHLEPAFHSVNMGGVVCLVVTDLSVFARAPHVVRRAFSAQVIKTEYLKEMAARVVLAEAARSAAKYNKGISVLYVVTHDDFLLLAVRVCRGQRAVDASLDCVVPLLHCRLCEERVFLPNQLAPLEQPYSHLPCSCKSSKTGKTAVIIGPMWRGPIFNTEFLKQVAAQGKKLHMSAKFFEIIDLLLVESRCSSSSEINQNLSATTKPVTQTHVQILSARSDDPFHEKRVHKNNDKDTCLTGADKMIFTPEKPIELSCEGLGGPGVNSSRDSALPQKRKLSADEEVKVLEDSSCVKQARLQLNAGEGREENVAVVPFYHNIRKFKKTVIHKLNKLVNILHKQGHRASRTHFDTCAIRTTASVEQFMKILD